jgi:hypothetical protein
MFQNLRRIDGKGLRIAQWDGPLLLQSRVGLVVRINVIVWSPGLQ